MIRGHSRRQPSTRADVFQRHLRDDKILGHHVNHQLHHNKKQQHKKQNQPAQNQGDHVRFGLSEPAHKESEARRDPDQNGETHDRNQAQQNLPDKKTPSRPLAPHPALSNAALFGDNAVEEHESHHAVHVDEQDEQHEPGDDEHCDQRSGERGIDGGQRALQKALRTIRMWHPEAARIAASPAARAHFTRQQTDQRQFGPLASPEGPQQLLPGMLKSRSNRIHGGNRQIAPQKMAVRSKVLRSGRDVKLIDELFDIYGLTK